MFLISEGRLAACSGHPAGEVAVPDTVAVIGSHAFEANPDLTGVFLPHTVRTISDAAFADCSMLAHVSLCDGLKRLGSGCFRRCVSLGRIVLPDTVASLHAGVFDGCTGLQAVRLSAGLRRNIEPRTFADCTSLESITIPAGIQQVKAGAFRGCTALRHVFFENEDVQIEPGAFDGCTALDEETTAFIEAYVIDRHVLNIRSHAPGTAGRLSNYTQRRFTFDGVACASIESVLQSFKCPDPVLQAAICSMSGRWAKHAGSEFAWQENQLLYWQGEAYPRLSQAYQQLLDRLYLTVYEQDEGFRADIAAIRSKKIDHRMGQSNPAETVLTRHEFVLRLQKLSEDALQPQA